MDGGDYIPISLGDERGEEKNRLRQYADIFLAAATLETDIAKANIAAYREHTFIFPISASSQLVLPEAFTQFEDPMTHVAITIGGEPGQPINVSIDIVGSDTELKISRNTHEEANTTDVVLDISTPTHRADSSLSRESTLDFDERLIEIPPITRAEMNALLMSAASPSNILVSAAFEEVDLNNPRYFDYLRDALSEASVYETGSFRHVFQDGDTVLSFYSEAGQPDSFSVLYSDPRSGRRIIAENDTTTRFELAFFAYEDSPACPEKLPLIPTMAELDHLHTLLTDEAEHINSLDTAFTQEEAVDTRDPESAFIESGRIILSKEMVRRVLGEHGFDPSDSGAA